MRSAQRRRAISRRAVRFSTVKKLERVRPACVDALALPSLRRSMRSLGSMSTSSTWSASSKTESGMRSRTMTPVIEATMSFRLSMCCTLTVV